MNDEDKERPPLPPMDFETKRTLWLFGAMAVIIILAMIFVGL
jgi:hypothetical protein